MHIDRNPKLLFWLITGLIFLLSGGYVFNRVLDQSPGDLIINEMVAGNVSGPTDEDGDYSDWIEIYNQGDYPINLAGWALTNDPSQPEKWPFPDVTLGAHDYLIVFASGKDRRVVEPGKFLHTNFRLSQLGEALALYNRLDDRFRDIIPAGTAQFEDIAYGRYGEDLQYAYLEHATPGEANAKLLARADTVSPVSFTVEPPEDTSTSAESATIANLLAWQPGEGEPVEMIRSGGQLTLDDGFWTIFNGTEEEIVASGGPLQITQIMYNPMDGDDYEFLRLTNLSDQPVILSGAFFEAGISFIFPATTPPLAPGDSIILAHNEAAFTGRYPGTVVGGIYEGQLSNSGESIILRDITSNVLASVTYDDENGWPLTADGLGDSLVLITGEGDSANPRHWRASSQVPRGLDITFLEP
jgi:hypothetical protein